MQNRINEPKADAFEYTVDKLAQFWNDLYQLNTGSASMVRADLRNYFSSPSKHPRLSQQLNLLKSNFPLELQDLIEALVDDIKKNDGKLVAFIKEQEDDNLLEILENRRTEEKISQELPQSLKTGNDHIIPAAILPLKKDIDSRVVRYKKFIEEMHDKIRYSLSCYQYAIAAKYCEDAYDSSNRMRELVKAHGKSNTLIDNMTSNMAYSQYYRGYICYLLGQYADASALYQASLHTYSTLFSKIDLDCYDMAKAQQALGLSLRRQGLQTDAYRAFEKALTLLENVRRKTEKINSIKSKIAHELTRQGALLDTAGMNLFSLFKPDAALPVNLFAVKRIQYELKGALTEEELKLLPLQEFMKLEAPLCDQLIKNIQRHRDAELDNPYLTAISDLLEEKHASSLADILAIEENKFAKLVEHHDAIFYLFRNQVTLQQLAQMDSQRLDKILAIIAENSALRIALGIEEYAQTEDQKQLITHLRNIIMGTVPVNQDEQILPKKKL